MWHADGLSVNRPRPPDRAGVQMPEYCGARKSQSMPAHLGGGSKLSLKWRWNVVSWRMTLHARFPPDEPGVPFVAVLVARSGDQTHSPNQWVPPFCRPRSSVRPTGLVAESRQLWPPRCTIRRLPPRAWGEDTDAQCSSPDPQLPPLRIGESTVRGVRSPAGPPPKPPMGGGLPISLIRPEGGVRVAQRGR